jgi:hypothetical protein
MATAAFAALPRGEPGTLSATLVIVLADDAFRSHPDTMESGCVPSPEWRDEEPTWEDAEWR